MTEDFERPIDKIIREARESGAFDDLPGKGKPIQWEDESLVPEDQRMAQRVIKNSGFTLDWIEQGQEIERDYKAARTDLEQAAAARAEERLDYAGWQSARAEFTRKVQAINKRIIGYNLRVPHEQFQRLPYAADPDRIV